MPRNIPRLLLILATASLPCIAQQPTTAPQIAGKVLRADTGAPIPGATVSIAPPFYSGIFVPPTTTTDQSGNYSFQTVNIGSSVGITATAEGYTWADYNRDGTPSGLMQHMDDATHLSGIDFHLAPEAVIRGSVTTDDGHPVAGGVPVSAFRKPQTPEGKPTYATKASTQADGSFAIHKLSAGTYTVVVNGPNEALGYRPNGVSYRQEWYVNQPTAENASYFALEPGDHRDGIDITGEPEKLYTVTVFPAGPDGRQAEGDYYWVAIKGRNTVGSGSGYGRTTFSYIPPGHYTLKTDVRSGSMSGKLLGTQETNVDVTNADVTLHITVEKQGA